ncbi:hypothetical protein F4804DRAFT_337502 [Jackrogersella minutella]|nr:hypothetical protein F4804DRAFT_337502 [Jackrogersella minutella]
MEQPGPSIPTDIPTAVPRSSPDSATPNHNHNTAAETSQPNSLDHISNSVPTLRFPRPLGNRQLTNWVSSSSPDIMQPENFPDDDPSLAELGYDVIGTDGESQAESTASSLDYQRPDDVQSLAGTDTGTDIDTNDADTDSSDDEEEDEEVTTLDDAALIGTISSTIVEYTGDADDEDADVETLANQSLENPTDFSQHGITRLRPVSLSDQLDMPEALSAIRNELTRDTVTSEEHIEHKLFTHDQNKQKDSSSEVYRSTLRYIQGHRRLLVVLSGLTIFYSLAIAGKYFLFNPPTPRVLSTVPVAAVSSAAGPSPVGNSMLTSVTTPTLANTQTQKALQTGSSSPSSLMFMPFGKDKTQTDIAQPVQQPICSAELYDRNEIMVKIPQDVKSAWLSRDAILIAVSRGIYDIPTKVSSVEEGFLIEVPVEEAHDVLAVSIATIWKPKVKETYHVDFGRNKFIGALDAGKQLVKGFAQKFVDTVNGTTAWVEETYIPALDVMSKQVCSQTSSVSDSLLQGLKDAGNAILDIPSHLASQITTQVKSNFNSDNIARRRHQVQLQLAREAQDLRDELAVRYLSAQLRSKLWWLRVQGKTEDYQHYLSKAEVHLKERVADAKATRQERAERVKKQIRSRRKHEHHGKRSSFWRKGTGQHQT